MNECVKCKLPQGETPTETVTGKGYGWKCTGCSWWNWIYRVKPEITTCSTMHCYNRAEVSDDPAKPPFCKDCKKKGKNANLSQST